MTLKTENYGKQYGKYNYNSSSFIEDGLKVKKGQSRPLDYV